MNPMIEVPQVHRSRCPFCDVPRAFEVSGPFYGCVRPTPACRLLYAFHELTGETDVLDLDLAYFTNVSRFLQVWPAASEAVH